MMEKKLKMASRKKRREPNFEKFLGASALSEYEMASGSLADRDRLRSSKLDKSEGSKRSQQLFEAEGKDDSHEFSRDLNSLDPGKEHVGPFIPEPEVVIPIPKVEDEASPPMLVLDSTMRFKQQLLEQLRMSPKSEERRTGGREAGHATSDSATVNANTSQAFYEHQKEKKLRRMETRKGAAIGKCLYLGSLQRRRLAEKALRSWRVLLISPHPNVVVYASVDTANQQLVSTDVNSMKQACLERAFRRVQRLLLRKSCELFHRWKDYCRFVRNIDTNLYSTVRTIELAETKQPLGNSEMPSPAPELRPDLRKLRAISAGLASLAGKLRERVGYAWDRLSRTVTRSEVRNRGELAGRKFRALQNMIEFRSRSLRQGLEKWRRKALELKYFLLHAKGKLNCLWRILVTQSRRSLFKYMKFWQERVRSIPRHKVLTLSPSREEDKDSEPDPSEIRSDDLEEEEVKVPRPSGKLGGNVFQGVIEENGEKLYKLLKTQPTLAEGTEDSHETRQRITDILWRPSFRKAREKALECIRTRINSCLEPEQ